MLNLNGTTLASNLLLSPIAGYCDLAFRLSIRPLGGLGLAYTDLVNPRGLLRQTVKSMELIETEPGDRPLAVQLYGHEPEIMADAARWCTDHLELAAIDINMGCPVDKVCKTNGGSALLRNPELAARLAERVVRAVDVPVTVKMRLGWDESSIVAPSLSAALEDVGVAAITIHGRTAAQAFRGRACQDGIARVVAAVRRIPVIGNGDVRSPADALAMMRRTGCAGVMIGRAALSDPWIFRDTHALLTTGRVPPAPTLAERLDFIRTHFEHSLRIRGERRACITFRQRVSWYLKAIGSFPAWRDRFRGLSSAAEFYALLDEFPQTVHLSRE
ncbi:MAG TPA: tRNA dihydrouridine synthase DusB [Phycisphaerae bacterium]|nr:tRNA dihydrouridine synthase DusB [Phycisphaerae bacterium]HOJ72510.1 tRNA dihydrouridine synthase DusB [Phycisphaerae bacterium]HOM49829.1 tRNA dihydrouridine synthase DusB [Phycisphaerae bacterium]HON65589.1 tRNA dihydrouridine synthase DusB [Phycisphaerae bacterium]HOQ84275.1 tRNA dihydrouridine synthase DusB [Phycisphaerae bacterium]